MMSNGTNAIASGLFVSSLGSLDLGTGLAGTARLLSALGSGTNIDLGLIPKGAGNLYVQSSSGGNILYIGTSALFTTATSATGDFSIGTFSSGAVDSAGVRISSGQTTTAQSGHIRLTTAYPSGAGKAGNYQIGGSTALSYSTWQDMEDGIWMSNVRTAPTGNPTNGLFKWIDGATKQAKIRDEDGNVYDETPRNGTITIELYNGGSDLTTGIKDTPVQVPYGATVTGWEIAAYDASNALLSTSVVVDILSDSFANLPLAGSDSIAGSEKPTLTGASTNSDNTITTWSAITEGNYIQAEIESVSAGTKKVVITIKVKKIS